MSNAIVRNPVLSFAEAETLVKSVHWFHRVEVLPGLIAPGSQPPTGSYDARSYVDSLAISDITNKRILEIGTWDGPIAFELASRGAKVVATDIQDPDRTGFNVLAKISGLDVPYVRCSVYELDKHFTDEFDVVIYFGVFYHLKHPILSFEKIAKVTKMGGLLLTEGAGMRRDFSGMNGEAIVLDDKLLDQLEDLDAKGIPLTVSYPGMAFGARNWIVPNKSALTGWLLNAGFEPVSVFTNGATRIMASAVKKRAESFIEHDVF